MEMREYLDTVSEQIRCKKARPMIVEEMKAHIEDQAEAFQREGMGEEKAIAMAVLEMGDPVETGIALDRIHRPKMQWTLVALVVLLSLIGMIMQIIIFKTGCLSNEQNITTIQSEYIYNSIINTVIGFIVIALVCVMDYTFIGKYPVEIWWGLCIIQLIFAKFIMLPGGFYRTYQLTYYCLTLMVPVYAAVIFRYKNKGMSGFLKCIGFYLTAVALILIGKTGFISSLLEITLPAFILLNIAVIKGWFGKKKAGKLFMLWIPAVIIPIFASFVAFYLNDRFGILAEYQAERIRAIFLQSEYANYTVLSTREAIGHVSLFGAKQLPLTTLPSIQNNYIVTSMFTYFGSLITLAVLGMIAFFLFKAFHLSIKQKNQLGSIISMGCVAVLLVKIVVYVISNLGASTVFGQMSMPFLSYGFGNAVISGALVGLLLSVYRNTNIVSEKNIKPGYRFQLPIQKI